MASKLNSLMESLSEAGAEYAKALKAASDLWTWLPGYLAHRKRGFDRIESVCLEANRLLDLTYAKPALAERIPHALRDWELFVEGLEGVSRSNSLLSWGGGGWSRPVWYDDTGHVRSTTAQHIRNHRGEFLFGAGWFIDAGKGTLLFNPGMDLRESTQLSQTEWNRTYWFGPAVEAVRRLLGPEGDLWRVEDVPSPEYGGCFIFHNEALASTVLTYLISLKK